MAKPHVFVTRTIPDAGLTLLKKRHRVTISSQDGPITKRANAVFVLTGKKGFDEKIGARSIPLYDTLRDLAVLEVPGLPGAHAPRSNVSPTTQPDLSRAHISNELMFPDG